MLPVPVSATAASDVTGISPLNSPVRSTPSRSIAPYQAMNTTAVIAIVQVGQRGQLVAVGARSTAAASRPGHDRGGQQHERRPGRRSRR